MGFLLSVINDATTRKIMKKPATGSHALQLPQSQEKGLDQTTGSKRLSDQSGPLNDFGISLFPGEKMNRPDPVKFFETGEGLIDAPSLSDENKPAVQEDVPLRYEKSDTPVAIVNETSFLDMKPEAQETELTSMAAQKKSTPEKGHFKQTTAVGNAVDPQVENQDKVDRNLNVLPGQKEDFLMDSPKKTAENLSQDYRHTENKFSVWKPLAIFQPSVRDNDSKNKDKSVQHVATDNRESRNDFQNETLQTKTPSQDKKQASVALKKPQQAPPEEIKTTGFSPIVKPVLTKKNRGVEESGTKSVLQFSESLQIRQYRNENAPEKTSENKEPARPAVVPTFAKQELPESSRPSWPQSRQMPQIPKQVEPTVQIGRIDVIVEAPIKPLTKPKSQQVLTGFASRHYLRRV